jgi:hypothetical protein
MLKNKETEAQRNGSYVQVTLQKFHEKEAKTQW